MPAVDAETLATPGVTAKLTYAVDAGELKRVYFPAMRRDEALVFKVYDSARDGRPRFTAHTSFVDPTTPADAPPRQSIEVRTLALTGPPGA